MINKNDLYDIAAALIRIRSDIGNNNNKFIVSNIIQVLSNDTPFCEDNQIRKSIAQTNNIDREIWAYVYHNNVYVNHQGVTNKTIYFLLINSLSQLIDLFEQNKLDNAYDLVDCIHCLPEILANNNYVIPKSYWKTFVKVYRNRWNKTFLLKEEKALRRTKDRGRLV